MQAAVVNNTSTISLITASWMEQHRQEKSTSQVPNNQSNSIKNSGFAEALT